jgi:hypothetical protein
LDLCFGTNVKPAGVGPRSIFEIFTQSCRYKKK